VKVGVLSKNMLKTFLLVVSLWGYNGATWVYTGNQMVYQQKFEELEKCQEMGRKFMKFDLNKYFTFKVQCIEDIRKDI
jgi:hypothetical protein